MRELADHTPKDRRRCCLRRPKRRLGRGSEGGCATDAWHTGKFCPLGRTYRLLRQAPVAPEVPTFDRFRSRTSPLADWKTLQALAARPLFGRPKKPNWLSSP